MIDPHAFVQPDGIPEPLYLLRLGMEHNVPESGQMRRLSGMV